VLPAVVSVQMIGWSSGARETAHSPSAKARVFRIMLIAEPELKIIDVFICKLRKKLANASRARTASRPSGVAAPCCASRPTRKSGSRRRRRRDPRDTKPRREAGFLFRPRPSKLPIGYVRDSPLRATLPCTQQTNSIEWKADHRVARVQ
jgi:hypothetical protein